ncbi:ABC-2 transporter permease [Thermoactinomyces mirandus]|uniref:ABC-2 transporter permease n=1 Tax=Thermoactinomyces mirandus TaxID=2756294 RepID=A0A7W1XR47_9BACL|nr:ABC-2 transporter permease [Thermoactinomyces mirandus]MBA4601758.1 ABC-2 transporter permease [Thermoactinomyces mirandus]
MYHLIKKDILIQKRSFPIAILLTLFFSFSFTEMGSAGLTLSVTAVTYMLTLGASALEDQNNSGKLLVSLPITRKKIVLAKYLSVYVFASFAILLNYLISLIVDFLRLPQGSLPLTAEGILGAVVAVTLMCSITFPPTFKLGYIKAKTIIFVLFFIMAFGVSSLAAKISQTGLFNENTLFTRISQFSITAIILAVTFIVLIISCLLSLNFYKKREF